MTKGEALRFIEASDANEFNVSEKNFKKCDLCGKGEYEREFVLSSKHIRDYINGEGYVYKMDGRATISKHICRKCFAKLFPGDVKEAPNEDF